MARRGPELTRSSREPREYVLPWPPLPERWKAWKTSRGKPKLKLTKAARHYRRDVRVIALTQTNDEKPFPGGTPVAVEMKLWYPYNTGQGALHQRASTVIEAMKGTAIRKTSQVRELHVERMPNDRYHPRVWVRFEEAEDGER